MAPILINCAASLASDLIEGISDKIAASSAQKTAAASSSDTDFAAAMASAQQTPAAKAAALADQQATLTSSLMSSPEVSSALAMADPSKGAQLEISSAGAVSVRSGNGSLKPINLTDKTRAVVTQLYGSKQPGVMPGMNGPSLVLAVDPARITPPMWSTLSARG